MAWMKNRPAYGRKKQKTENGTLTCNKKAIPGIMIYNNGSVFLLASPPHQPTIRRTFIPSYILLPIRQLVDEKQWTMWYYPRDSKRWNYIDSQFSINVRPDRQKLQTIEKRRKEKGGGCIILEDIFGIGIYVEYKIS